MFINYEHENHVYNVSIERRDKHYFITYDNTEYKVQAEELKPGHLKIKIGDRFVKSIISTITTTTTAKKSIRVL